MTKIGIGLSAEEHGPGDLARFTAMAAEHGFGDVWVSDHFHPWNDEQGQSPFVWTALGAMAQAAPGLRLGTGVTCPLIRMHPAIVAQAAATTAALAEATGGSFFLGVGTGEALNEHILGDRWPPASVRLDMLEEAVEVMCRLWAGDQVTHHGHHYTVENARLYTLAGQPPPVYVSAFGPQAVDVAARVGDGLVTTAPDADAVRQYRDAGGEGPVLASPKVCWAPDEASARKQVFKLWPNSGLPGQLSQELATPALFEQAIQAVTEEDAVGAFPVGPDPEAHVASLRTYIDAGFDQLYVQQIGKDQGPFLAFYRDEVLPRLG